MGQYNIELSIHRFDIDTRIVWYRIVELNIEISDISR